MITFKYVIKDSAGIHARPAGMLVKEAQKFKSSITVSAKGKTAEATRLFSLMSLGAAKGDEITVTISGADEETAESAILGFLESIL